jgi:hypothetical protein
LGKRKAEIIASDCVMGDSSFACHETTGAKGGRDDPENYSHCAGAMILTEKERGDVAANLFLRLAIMSGALPRKPELRGADVVHDSVNDFINHHT